MTDTIKPEVGKTYLTRDGRKARCICTDRLSSRSPVICLVQIEDVETVCSYAADGHYRSDRSRGDYDLVSEAPRIVTVNVWVELTPEGKMVANSQHYFHAGSPGNTMVKITQDVELPNV